MENGIKNYFDVDPFFHDYNNNNRNDFTKNKENKKCKQYESLKND